MLGSIALLLVVMMNNGIVHWLLREGVSLQLITQTSAPELVTLLSAALSRRSASTPRGLIDLLAEVRTAMIARLRQRPRANV